VTPPSGQLVRHPRWAGGARFDLDASAMWPAAKALPMVDRLQSLRLVEDELQRFTAGAVDQASREFAARRVVVLRALGKGDKADEYFARAKPHFDAEKLEARVARLQAERPEAIARPWDAYLKAEPSEEWLQGQLGEAVADHESLAAAALALRSVEPSEATVESAGLPDERSPSAVTRADPRSRSLDAGMRRVLGPQFASVDRIATLLGHAAGNHPDEWVKARLDSFRQGPDALELRFQEAARALWLLRNELATARRKASGEPEVSADMPRKRLLGIASERALRGRTKMSNAELADALSRPPSTGREGPDRARPVDVVESEIRTRRDVWLQENGALAAVHLHAEREGRRRELERAPEIEPGRGPGGGPDTGIDPF
jgi:hypothetical protein